MQFGKTEVSFRRITCFNSGLLFEIANAKNCNLNRDEVFLVGSILAVALSTSHWYQALIPHRGLKLIRAHTKKVLLQLNLSARYIISKRLFLVPKICSEQLRTGNVGFNEIVRGPTKHVEVRDSILLVKNIVKN